MSKSKHSALVVGLGLFGRATAERLRALGWDVVGIDEDAAVVQELRDSLSYVVQLDACDEEALATIGVPDFEVCIITSSESLENSILLALNLQQLGAKYTVAKVASVYHARIMWRLGVDRVIFPEYEGGTRLAETLQSPHLVAWIDLSKEQELGVVRVPETRAGSSLKEWKELQRPALQVLGRLSATGQVLELDWDVALERDETLVVVGPLAEILAVGQ
jgi:trk system potassium uptake protein TrkA